MCALWHRTVIVPRSIDLERSFHFSLQDSLSTYSCGLTGLMTPQRKMPQDNHCALRAPVQLIVTAAKERVRMQTHIMGCTWRPSGQGQRTHAEGTVKNDWQSPKTKTMEWCKLTNMYQLTCASKQENPQVISVTWATLVAHWRHTRHCMSRWQATGKKNMPVNRRCPSTSTRNFVRSSGREERSKNLESVADSGQMESYPPCGAKSDTRTVPCFFLFCSGSRAGAPACTRLAPR